MGKEFDDIMKGAGVAYDPEAPQGEKVTTAPQVTLADKLRGGMDVVQESWDAMTGAAPLTALEKSVYCKRIEDAVEMIRTEVLLGPANAEFAAAMVNPAQKVLSVAGAALKRYKYPVKYEYPATVKRIEDQFKQAKKVSEVDGSAKIIPKVLDPNVDTTFTITA